MKKVLLAILLVVGISQYSEAQLQFGIKAGVNYNSDSFSDVSNDVFNGAESRTGYHAGIWFRAKLPVVGLYLRPELVYTELSNNVNYDNSVLQRQTEFSFSQYILSSDFGLSDLTEISTNEFSLGIQMGFGLEFGRLGVDVRWERGLSKNETVFVDNNVSSNINFDTRVNQIIFGLAYRL